MTNNLKIYLLSFLMLAAVYHSEAQSPYELTWGNDAVLSGAAAGSGIAAYLLNRNLTGMTEEEVNALNPDDINSFDRFAVNYYSPGLSDASDVMLYSLAASPALLLFSPEVRSDYLTVGTMYAQTLVFAAALPYIAKGLVKRPRPYAYNSDAAMSARTEPEARRSFFSGHSAITFASAVFLSRVYSDYYPGSKYTPYIWAGSLLTAGTVAAFRVFSGKHFPTDVLTGAVVGSAIGWLIPELHKKTNDPNMSFAPGLLGFSFSYKF